MRTILILILMGGMLAGCSSGESLPQARGPLFPLNAGLWQPAPGDLAQAPKVAQQ